MTEKISYTGIVLAGGKSSRFGKNKATALFNNKKLIDHSIALLQNFCSHTIISASNQDYSYTGLQVVKDIYQNIGPLGGIVSSLRETKNTYNIILACDLPFLSEHLINYLINKHNKQKAIVPVHNNKIEPLVGIYSKELLPLLLKNIELKNYKMMDALETANASFLNTDEYSADNFKNINTPNDLQNIKDVF